LDNGGEWLKQIFNLRQNDLVLALGYPQILENESDWLIRNSIYLPITMPEEFWNYANTHHGNSKNALFLCSNRLSSEYYANQFDQFKKVIGSNPYVVVDSIDPSNGHSNVIYRPTDQELIRLFQESSVYYSPSKELRTTLYSPIEASVIGCPIIYHAESLLGRLTPEVQFGKVSSFEEAQSIANRILDGDTELSQELIQNQKVIAQKFKVSNCIETWRSNLPGAVSETALIEEMRSSGESNFSKSLYPFPHELLPIYFDQEIISLNEANLNCTNGLFEINFLHGEPTPWFVKKIKGISWPEDFGRWTSGSLLEIEFLIDLPRKFHLKILTSSIGKNLGKKVRVSAGSRNSNFRIKSLDLVEYSIGCVAAEKSKKLTIEIPYPTQPNNDSRKLGLAIRSIKIS
jgi:hypothetical protein